MSGYKRHGLHLGNEPSKIDPPSTPSRDRQKELEDQVAAFLDKGGTIEHVPRGASGAVKPDGYLRNKHIKLKGTKGQ